MCLHPFIAHGLENNRREYPPVVFSPIFFIVSMPAWAVWLDYVLLVFAILRVAVSHDVRLPLCHEFTSDSYAVTLRL